DRKVKQSDDSEERGQACDHQEQNAKEYTLTSATFAAAIITRNHSKARTRIVIAVHPGYRKEMRQLPQQEDREETPCPRLDCSARRRPTDHWRNRPRNGADEGIRGAGPLQRRVTKNINEYRNRGERGAERVAGNREITNAKNRKNDAESKGFGRSHATSRNGARSRSTHQGVELAFPPLVERSRPGRRCCCSKHNMKQHCVIDR